jgi:hypothetical protein
MGEAIFPHLRLWEGLNQPFADGTRGPFVV